MTFDAVDADKLRAEFHEARRVAALRARWDIDDPKAPPDACRYCGRYWQRDLMGVLRWGRWPSLASTSARYPNAGIVSWVEPVQPHRVTSKLMDVPLNRRLEIDQTPKPRRMPNEAGARCRGASQFALLVLDIDRKTEAETCTLREELLRFRHLAHATHADRPNDRCLRVVLPLSRAITLAEEQALRTTLTPQWGPFSAADRTSTNGRRVHYIASRPRGADFFFKTHEGDPLDVDGLLATETLS